MIQLELKVKHYYLIAEILFGFAAYTTFSTLEKIKSACSGVAEDDLVTVETDPNTIVSVFQTLSQRPEGSYNQVNGEMLDLLMPQIQAGITAGDQEWIFLGQTISEIRANNLAIITTSIQNGKNRLYN
jgi:hypothetical protein